MIVHIWSHQQGNCTLNWYLVESGNTMHQPNPPLSSNAITPENTITMNLNEHNSEYPSCMNSEWATTLDYAFSWTHNIHWCTVHCNGHTLILLHCNRHTVMHLMDCYTVMDMHCDALIHCDALLHWTNIHSYGGTVTDIRCDSLHCNGHTLYRTYCCTVMVIHCDGLILVLHSYILKHLYCCTLSATLWWRIHCVAHMTDMECTHTLHMMAHCDAFMHCNGHTRCCTYTLWPEITRKLPSCVHLTRVLRCWEFRRCTIHMHTHCNCTQSLMFPNGPLPLFSAQRLHNQSIHRFYATGSTGRITHWIFLEDWNPHGLLLFQWCARYCEWSYYSAYKT